MTLRVVGSWAERAKCVGVDPDVFFPTAAEGREVQAAKDFCWGRDGGYPCPVRAECLAFVDSLPAATQGIWGGYSQRERRSARRRRKEAARRMEATG